MGKIASVEELQGKMSKRRYREVTDPFTHSTFRLQSLFEGERQDLIERRCHKKNGDADIDRVYQIRCLMVIACCVDEKGERLFKLHHLGMISKWDSAVTNWLSDQISDHLGLKAGEIEDMAEDAVKNLGEITSDDST